MARIDTLRLLVHAEMPRTLEGVELSLRAITSRIDCVQPDTPDHDTVHRRIDALLTLRESMLDDTKLIDRNA